MGYIKQLGTRRVIMLTVFVVFLTVAIALSAFGSPLGNKNEVNLNEFIDLIETDQITTANVLDRSSVIFGEKVDGGEYRVLYPREFGDELFAKLTEANPRIEVTTENEVPSILSRFVSALFPVIAMALVFIFIFRQIQGRSGMLSMGKSRAREFDKDSPQITFSDVAGANEAVEELAEIRDFLSDPERFGELGARIPRGVLLCGPPGTGKTLLARAIAGEAGVPFFSISGSDFVEMFVGVGASRVRDLFEQAKKAAPAIIFIDEIDAVGRQRGNGAGAGHDEREQTLNQLLVEMDGFDAGTGVILVAATNRPDILDPALLRPGRFDRRVVVDQPDMAGRVEILRVHSAGKPLIDGVDLETIAKRTPGFTGADLANLLNEAALLAVRDNQARITDNHISRAIDRVIAGPERKSRVMSDHEKKVIAYHESGHAIVGHVLQHTDRVHKVSIVARGRALGWTMTLPDREKYLRSRSELRSELAMLLGGRAAEEIVFGDPTTGAHDDIDRATNLAQAMVTQWGMSEDLGPQRFGTGTSETYLGTQGVKTADYAADIAVRIDREVAGLLDVAFKEACAILTYHRATLRELADALVEHETVADAALAGILGAEGTWDTTRTRTEIKPVAGADAERA